jgi:glycosyltransferase involved in cell wall biosynthesis
VGDVQALTQHISLLCEDPKLLERLRAASLRTVNEITWTAAGKVLVDVYRETIELHGDRQQKENLVGLEQ